MSSTTKRLDKVMGGQAPNAAEVREGSLAQALRWAIVALAIAAVLDLLIYRTFSRVGVFIPKDEPRQATFRTVYTVSVQIGNIFVNFAVLLAVAVIGLAIWRFRQTGEFGAVAWKGISGTTLARNRWLTVALVAMLVVVVFGVWLLAVVIDDGISTVIRLAQIVALVGLVADAWLAKRDWLWRLFLGLMLAAYLLSILAKVASVAVLPLLGLNIENVLVPFLTETGEILAVVNGLVTFVVFTRREDGQAVSLTRSMLKHWPALLGAVVVVAVFIGLTVLTIAESYIVPILALYALGYAMHWPTAIYVIALFALFYTIFYLVGSFFGKAARLPGAYQKRAYALALILIFAGGYTFSISDQYLFALIGVLLLARPELMEA